MTSLLSAVSSNYLPEIVDFADFSDWSAVFAFGAAFLKEVLLAFPPVFSKSPVAAKGGASSGASGSNLNQGQADSGTSGASTSINGSSTPSKMAGEFENTGGKAKSTSFKKTVTANTADGSEKSAKSTISGK